MPWWFLAPLLGAWMNFVLTFFAYDTLAAAMASVFGPEGILSSPFWFVAEGAIVGLIIGFAATRFGGEGPETVAQTGRRAFCRRRCGCSTRDCRTFEPPGLLALPVRPEVSAIGRNRLSEIVLMLRSVQEPMAGGVGYGRQ